MSSYTQETVRVDQLMPGDQIAVKGDGYYHHGIYIGENQVIDYGGPTKSEATIKQRNIDDFTADGQRNLVRIIYANLKDVKDPEDVVKTAKDEVRNPSRWSGFFDLLKKNCEHFATFCKTGIAFSKQVALGIQMKLMNLSQIISTSVGASVSGPLGASVGSLFGASACSSIGRKF